MEPFGKDTVQSLRWNGEELGDLWLWPAESVPTQAGNTEIPKTHKTKHVFQGHRIFMFREKLTVCVFESFYCKKKKHTHTGIMC